MSLEAALGKKPYLNLRSYCGKCIDAFGSPASKLWLDGLDRTLNSPVSVVFRLFYSNGNPSDRKLVISSIIFYGAIYFGLKYGVQALVAFLVSL